MLAYINRNNPFNINVSRSDNGQLILKVPFVNATIEPVRPDAISQTDVNALKTAAAQHQQLKQCHTCVHLVTSPTDQNVVTVRVHGFLWKKIPGFYQQNNLKLRISMMLHSPNYDAQMGEFLFIDTDYKSDLSKNRQNLDTSHESCIGVDEAFSESVQGAALYNFLNLHGHGHYYISISAQMYLYNDDPVHRMACLTSSPTQDKLAIYQKILTDKVRSDVTIVCSDKHEFPCHTAFLSAHSPVFAAMFENDMKESKTRKVELPEMSQRTVKAFLGFLYFWDEEEPQKDSALVFELLEAGHKYAITALQDRMRDIIVGKPNNWFDEEVALRLFFFTRNVEGCNDVKLKAVDIIKSQSEKVLASECYNKLFDENPTAASKAVMELCLHAFKP